MYYQEPLTAVEVSDISLWPDSVRGLLAVIINHNMTLDTCYEICVLMGQICDKKTPRGAVDWLRQKINEENK